VPGEAAGAGFEGICLNADQICRAPVTLA